MLMLPTAGFAHVASIGMPTTSDKQSTLQQALMSAMATACNSGLFSCTASLSGVAGKDTQDVLRILSLLGYSYSIAGTTLTIKW